MKGASYPSAFLFMNHGGPPSHSGVVLERQEGRSTEWMLFPWVTQPGQKLNW